MPKTFPSFLVGFLVSAHCLAQSASRDGISPQERLVLVDVFQSTDGKHWKNHDGWLGAPGTECDWHGVMCERGADGSRSITQLDLSENNLDGRTPDKISELAHLKSLIIFGNRLSGRLPDVIVERWLEGALWVTAETSLLTDISLIDFESSPSALLCGQRRLLLRADTDAVSYINRCRNATSSDRTTYCEVKQGKIWGQEFARLAWLLEKNGFFALKPNYERNVSDSTFVSTRVVRLGKSYEVVDYAGGGPLSLWAIHRSIEGVGSSLDWEKATTQPACPAWKQSDTAPQK